MTQDLLDMAALTRLLDVIGGDPEDFDEMRDEYFDSVPEIVAELQAAAAAGDVARLRVASHSLKGNARDFGALHLAELCGALEVACKSGAVENATEAVAAIVTAEAAAAAALRLVDGHDLG